METSYDNVCTERMLVVAAKKGDTKAFAKLYETVYLDLYRFALYTMKHNQDAEDMVSETVILAYENICKLRKVDAFRSWIFKILINNCKKKWCRKEVQTQELQEIEAVKEEDVGARQDIKNALAELTDEERYIIALSVFGGYNSKEIGGILKLKNSTIRSKLSRGLEKMSLKLSS